MKFSKGQNVICRNVPGVVISYDKELSYYKVREIKTGSIMPFVNEHEIKIVEDIPNVIEEALITSTILENAIGVEEASKLLGFSPGYIKNLCAERKIVSKKIGNTWIIDKTKLNQQSAE